MIDLDNVKKKTKHLEYVGGRVEMSTKTWVDRFCSERKISVSGLINELIESFKREQENKIKALQRKLKVSQPNVDE